MRVVALVLLLALPAAAAEPCEVFPILVATGTLRTERGDIPLAVRGGQYLTEESAVCIAQRLVRAEAQVAVYERAPVITPPAFIVATSVAVIIGAIVGFVARGAAR